MVSCNPESKGNPGRIVRAIPALDKNLYMLNPAQIKAINHFAKRAYEFCQWAEAIDHDGASELNTAMKHLATLFIEAMNLPDIFDDESPESPSIDYATYRLIYNRFAKLPLLEYWEVFNPLENDNPVLHSLADDLADIYWDLKDGLLLYEAGFLAGAGWEWSFNFHIHWGKHLVDAQRVLFWWIND